MMKKITLLSIIFFQIHSVSSQGVMNRRFSASYEAGIAHLGRTVFFDRYFYLCHSTDINYSISKRLSLGLGFNYGRRSIQEEGSISSGNLGGLDNEFISNLTNIEIDDISFALKLRFYPKKRGSVAPIGSYWGLAYEFGKQNGMSSEIVEGVINSKIYTYDEKNRQNLSVLTLTYGRNIVFNYRYMLGYGFTTGYNFNREMQFRRFLGRPFVNIGILF